MEAGTLGTGDLRRWRFLASPHGTRICTSSPSPFLLWAMAVSLSPRSFSLRPAPGSPGSGNSTLTTSSIISPSNSNLPPSWGPLGSQGPEEDALPWLALDMSIANAGAQSARSHKSTRCKEAQPTQWTQISFANICKYREWHAKHVKAKKEGKPPNASFSSLGVTRGMDLQSSCRIRPGVTWHRKRTSIECAIDKKHKSCSQIFVSVENGTQST